MNINADKAKLVETLTAMDVDCFYGKLKWDEKGQMQKPMYTEQLQGVDPTWTKKIVAPTGGPPDYPLSGNSCWGGWTVRLGGHIQSEYVSPLQLWVDWANSKGDYKVDASLVTYNSATMAADVTKMTTAGDASYVDALVCPYGSTAVKACVDAVNTAYIGPVLDFGGASDTIFTANCAALPNKNCFGFLTVASLYTESGLVALDAASSTTLKVAIITNNNAFSESVAAGTKATIGARAGLTEQSYTKISVAKQALTAADKSDIDKAMEQMPDVVVVTGHNLDVEPAVIQIGKNPHVPGAVLAVNGLSQLTNYGSDSVYSTCIMMPTQWDSTTSTKDPVVKWTSADFITAMNDAATYQQAAAGSVGVGLANALNECLVVDMKPLSACKTQIVSYLTSMDVDSFYGKLKWDSMGRMQKPMYTQQLKGSAKEIVAPTGTVAYPLSSADCWGKLLKFGFRMNDKVSWKRDDPNALAKGTIGTVVGFTDEHVRVEWPDGTYLHDPKELNREAPDAVSSGMNLMPGAAFVLACFYRMWVCFTL